MLPILMSHAQKAAGIFSDISVCPNLYTAYISSVTQRIIDNKPNVAHVGNSEVIGFCFSEAAVVNKGQLAAAAGWLLCGFAFNTLLVRQCCNTHAQAPAHAHTHTGIILGKCFDWNSLTSLSR